MGRKHKRRKKTRHQDEPTAPIRPITPEVTALMETWAAEAAQSFELELIDLEMKSARGPWLIRVYVDHSIASLPGEGVTVDECAEVSRYLEAYLDADDRVPERYVLEVSSPGIERPINKREYLPRLIGRLVQVTTHEPVDGQNKIVGKLLSFDDGVLRLHRTEEDSDVEVAWDDVARAKLKYDFSGVQER